ERPFEREVRDRLVAIEEMVKNITENLGDASKTTYQNQRDIISLKEKQEQLQKDMEDIQEEQKWLKHTILAAVITGAVGIVILYVKVGMGI
ncbi:MAG: hypothetical protein PHW47_06705, partial [Lachnospira sp.]|nr:hypothetical protein [Lachnospira sp.]